MKQRVCVLMAIITVFAVMVPATSVMAQDQQPATPSRTKFDPSRDAAKDIANAVKLAASERKNVLLDIGGEWCIWCHRLDSLYIKNADLEKYLLDNYVVVKVNVSKENKNEEVLKNYPKIPGYPHLFVLDAKGELLHSQDTGELEEGKGHSKEKVMAFLKKWAPKKD